MRFQSALVKILTFVVTVVATVGCQKNDGNASRVSGPRSSLAASGASSAGLSFVGTVSSSASYQAQFQDAVTGFLSTDVNPAYVGTVNATPSAASGVYFAGQVTLSSGSVRNVSAQSATVTGGRFGLEVMDMTGVAGAPVIPPFVLSTATGYVQGTSATLQFSDNYGTLNMQGSIDTTNNIFTGTMSYDNNVMYNGDTPGAAGTLGTFSIPLCQFFSC